MWQENPLQSLQEKTMVERVRRPNQSLKLTEPAVDDLARAKQPAAIGLDIPRAE